MKTIVFDASSQAYLESVLGDAAATVMITRQLLQIQARVYEVKYAELPYRELFPVTHEIDEGATVLAYHVADKVGIAKIIGNYADDLPRSDVFMKEVQSNLKVGGSSFGYTTEEIRNAKFARKPLAQAKANASRRAMEQLFNTIAFVGDDESGLPGFLTNANITETVAANGATSGTPLWSGKDPDEILADVNTLVSTIWETTLMVEAPDSLLLPPAQYSLIHNTRLAAGTDTTILQYIYNNNQFLKPGSIRPTNQMTGSGPGSTDQMVAYTNSPEKLLAHIPMEQKFLPVQMKGLEFVVPSEAKTGGVVIMYPLSVATSSGI